MERLVFLVLFYWLTSCPNCHLATGKLKTMYEWREIEFDFTSDEEREEAIKNGTYNEGQVQPVDVDVYSPCNKRKKIVFITCPRIYDNNGVPASVGTISDRKRNGNPIITPYPNWEWHTNPEMCKRNRIVSVYRIFIDDCHRLWIVDNGQVGSIQVCPPQILAFNLKTNALDRQYEIPADEHLNTSLYSTIVAETTSCQETFVYITDVSAFSLVVYDYKNNKSWKILDKTFNPSPDQINFDVDGIKFSYMDGLLALALSHFVDGPKRRLFYHAMAAVTENWVYTKDLKNESLVSGSYKAPQVFHTFSKTRSGQSSVEAADSKGHLFFGLLHNMSIVAWNMKKPYDESNFQIIGDNKDTMQFPGGIKVINDKKEGESLWVFCSRLQIVLAGKKLNSSEINFRIFSANIAKLLADDGNNIKGKCTN